MRGTCQAEPACPKCRSSSRKRVGPLTIEWDVGSDIIADFTWPSGLGELVVTEQVKTTFVSEGFTGLRYEPVEMYQRPGLKRPRRDGKARKRVWLPYDGPPLWSLLVSPLCNLDLARSCRSIVIECEICTRSRMIVHDRVAPLVVRRESWHDADFFRIGEMGNLTFVTERVKQAIERNHFTNVTMRQRGYVEGESI
jgi:hypothetical protein